MNEEKKLTIVIEEVADVLDVTIIGNANKQMLAYRLSSIIHAFRKSGSFSMLDVLRAIVASDKVEG